MRRTLHPLALLSLLSLVAACGKFEGDETRPAYLSITAFDVVDDATNTRSTNPGFFENAVDAVNLVAYFEGDEAETELGTFQLPCKIPVLRRGTAKRLTIYPVVQQNGVAGTRIPYPYYEAVTLNNVALQTDSLTELGTLTTHYGSHNLMRVAWEEYFEDWVQGYTLDTIVRRLDDRDTARTGVSCGVVRVTPDTNLISFAGPNVSLGAAGNYIYLELSYWCDVEFGVGLQGPTSSNASEVRYIGVKMRPTTGWKKIYINLGRLWRDFNFYSTLRPYFEIYNPDLKSGNVFIDNIKLVVM